MHETLCQATSERDIFDPGFDSAPVAQRKLDTVLMVNDRITVLNPNDKIPCNSTSRRISRDVTATSETWQVMPMTNEKYAKSRWSGKSSSGKFRPPACFSALVGRSS